MVRACKALTAATSGLTQWLIALGCWASQEAMKDQLQHLKGSQVKSADSQVSRQPSQYTVKSAGSQISRQPNQQAAKSAYSQVSIQPSQPQAQAHKAHCGTHQHTPQTAKQPNTTLLDCILYLMQYPYGQAFYQAMQTSVSLGKCV